jgi:hypothetical protein
VPDISIDNLADVIQAEVNRYGAAIREETRKTIQEAGKAALEAVKEHAPVREGKGGGKYRDSLKVTYNPKEAGTAAITTGEDAGYALIYASDGQYRLTHLLENGHPMPQGGRARAIPHWRYGEEAAERTLDTLEEKLERVD